MTLEIDGYSLKQMLDQQNNMCAGCGMKISKLYIRRMQYCNYYNKLFCQRCHQGAKMRIPARVIHQWNFREYPVSDIARRFLLDNYSQPAIDVLAVDAHFYDKFKNLRNVRLLRLQLVHLWSFIRICSTAKSTFTMHGNLLSVFSCIPKHILEDVNLYSMLDFEDVKNGNLIRLIEPVVQYGKCHVNSCEVSICRFVCELCDQRDDLLFPFQLNKVSRCEECGSLSHIKCAARRIKQLLPCPKCVRIALNRLMLLLINLDVF
uniref:DUF4206 domain-containing protein n=1 Tax=Syphacia muris TaxID=451379 RepID=A0A0N5AZ03_9BILA